MTSGPLGLLASVSALGAEAGTLRRMVPLEAFPSVALGLLGGGVWAF
ncbi:MAG TPA: hypothetical protein QF572_19325 [Vicinamibacterales bacterium]|jgi:hypothetical protein|nr:hypothetical protein [Vicinamibacterales bacterium]|tara:strand:+ start:196 stop:336 length:141 start_codon:yes stop_codon:yes gene_type:complete